MLNVINFAFRLSFPRFNVPIKAKPIFVLSYFHLKKKKKASNSNAV